MPYEVWLKGIRLLRPDLNTDTKCPQCGTTCLERHAHECRRRDTNTFYVLPPEDNPAPIVRGVHAQAARARELDAQAPAARAKYTERLAQDPNHQVPAAVLAASCYNSETDRRCGFCQKCLQCQENKCWGNCNHCRRCKRCTRALLQAPELYGP